MVERVAAPATRVESGRLRQAQQRRARWRQAAPFGLAPPNGAADAPTGDVLWQRRLAAAGLSETRLLDILAGDCGPQPEWAADLASAYTRATGDGAGTRPASADPTGDVDLPFLGLVEPLLRWLHQRLTAATGSVREDHLPPAAVVAELMLHRLAPRLHGMVQRTCLLELAACRRDGVLAGDTAEERFLSFRGRLDEPAERWRLLTRYPVLARQLVVTGRAWVRQSGVFVDRLAADLPELRRTFSPHTDPGPVVDIVAELGDPHRGAQTVSMVRFASGLRIMYKPRSAAVDVHFQDLLRWVNDRTPGLQLRVLRCLDRGDYGWMEYVESTEPADRAATQRLYRRQGRLLALLYLVHAGDFHADNVIVAGEQPVLVDLETLFQPELPSLRPAGESEAERRAAELASGSVMRAGFLPVRPTPWGGDISGLRTAERARAEPTVRVATIVSPATDQMRIRLAQPEADAVGPPAQSPVRPADQVRYVLDGFREVYRLLMAHREALTASSGPLAPFAGDEVRVLVRDTAAYALLLSTSFHPSLLVDGLDRDQHFDRLWSDAVRRPGISAVTEAERRDLWCGDIPIFTTTVSGGPLRDSRGRAVPGVTVRSGLEVTGELVDRLGEEDLARQSWLIHGSITMNGVRREGRFSFTRHATGPADQPASDTRLVDASAAVADRLAALAIRADGGATWIGPHFGSHRACAVGVLGPNLYDGLLGMALFLAHHAELVGDDKIRKLARDTTRTAIAQLRRGLPGSLIGFAGRGGVVYALSHLGVLWTDQALLDEATRVAEEIGALVADDVQYEVMEGAAGALLGLLARYRARPSGRVLDLLRTTADHLVSTQRAYGCGASWLPSRAVTSGVAARPLAGFGHGTAGISAALSTAADLLGENSYLDAARRGFDYERGLFDADGGYWHDLRDVSNAEDEIQIDFDGGPGVRFERPVAWCHGSAGIGIARLRAGAQLDVAVDLAAAIEDTVREGFGNGHSLCHGDAGSLDFLQLAADRTADPVLLRRVRCQATTMLDTIDERGWRSGLHDDVEIPGLLTGLAGIGYGMLRLLAPHRVPSVLAQEPGPPRRSARSRLT
ncbi:type 2 lanthipeptide synthetase LanM family protein [Micromonospora sp. DT231]|uniref:type 2 lanthipeptide synthetase LanM family protein n=1 Tax=Micromonospora sp. DT231 TaxID=3416526 RepID=UPI003CF96853